MDIICCTQGINLTAGLASTNAALPVDTNGNSPAVVRVCAVGTASVFVSLGTAGVTASTSGLLLTSGREVALDCSGMTHIAAIQAGLNLGGLVNVVPYE